jgi:hypothetical protein
VRYAANAVTAAHTVKQRLNLLFIDCFKCVDVGPDPWTDIEMTLDTVTGNLHAKINDNAPVHVFKGLPTHKALYPCLMAVNTAQAHFELLEARFA